MSWTRQTFAALCAAGIVVFSFLVVFAALADGTVYVTFVKKLLAPDGEANDRFGYVHSVDGDRLAVSALGDDDAGAGAGSVTVFERNAGGIDNWGAVAKFVASDGAADDRFGQGLSLAGDVLFVGPFNYETPKPGAAYVFDLRGPSSAWGEVARLVPSDGTVNDFFGRFLATNGEIAFIGAFGEDSAASGSGAVYLFEGDPGDPGVWTETHKLKAPVPDANDFFGRRFGFDDSSLVVAAFLDDDNGTDAGAAYVFEPSLLDPTQWSLDRKVLASDGMAGDNFGRHTIVDGDVAAIGAWRHDAAGVDAGATYLFRRFAPGQPSWQELAKLLPADIVTDDRFGIGLALSRDLLAVGAPFHDAAGIDAGAVYIFSRHANGRDAWGQVAKLTAEDAAPGDLFGYWLSARDKTLVVGARRDDNQNGIDAGGAYLYAVEQPEADLRVHLLDFGQPVQPGMLLRLSVLVRNEGPELAVDTLAGGQLFGAALVVAVRSTRGACLVEPPFGPTYTCDLGDLAAGTTSRIDLFVVPQAAAPFLHVADVGSVVADPERNNNTSQLLVQ